MKLILGLLFLTVFVKPVEWQTDFDKAKDEAVQTHKFIILNFSGSDWCGPCIRMKKEIFDTDAFEEFAGKNLVLVRADFPRLKKNQLSSEQTKRNEALAAKYNPEGKFPFTILLNEKGSPIKIWEGFPNESPEKFLTEINSFQHASN